MTEEPNIDDQPSCDPDVAAQTVHQAASKANTSGGESAATAHGGILAQLERFQSAIVILAAAPVAVVGIFLFLDDRYARSENLEVLREAPPESTKTYVQTYVADQMDEFGKIIGKNSDNISVVSQRVLEQKDDLLELPLRIQSYTDCIIVELQDFASNVASRESNRVGKLTSHRRRAQIEAFCGQDGTRCEVGTLIHVLQSDDENHDDEIRFSEDEIRDIKTRISVCSARLRADTR